MIKAIIIDDIEDSRINLAADLRDYCPQVEMIGEADSVVNALKLIKSSSPQLVFLDIHLGDGTGFDILELLPQIEFKVIFTTSSDAFAIKAFKYSAIDYLLKPIDPDELLQAVNQAEGQYRLEHPQVEILMRHLKKEEQISKLALSTLDKIHVVEISDIVRCESSDNYTIFYFNDKTKLMVSKTLKTYENLLVECDFYRVHQKHLVNKLFIKEFVKTDGGYLKLKDGENIPVSTRKRAEVMQMISKG